MGATVVIASFCFKCNKMLEFQMAMKFTPFIFKRLRNRGPRVPFHPTVLHFSGISISLIWMLNIHYIYFSVGWAVVQVTQKAHNLYQIAGFLLWSKVFDIIWVGQIKRLSCFFEYLLRCDSQLFLLILEQHLFVIADQWQILRGPWRGWIVLHFPKNVFIIASDSWFHIALKFIFSYVFLLSPPPRRKTWTSAFVIYLWW